MHVAPDFAYSKRLAWFDCCLLVYMDDILVISYMHDHAHICKLLALLAELFDLFGITINPDKSLLEPAQEVECLGMLLHTNGILCLTPRCIAKICAAATSLLCMAAANHRFVPMRALRSVAGLVSSTYACCQYAHLYARCIYVDLLTYLARYRHYPGFSKRSGLPCRRVKLH